jgi:DNA polymerase V
MTCVEIVPQHIKDPWLTPLKGEVHCGLFGLTEDYQEKSLSLDELMIKNKEATFFFYAGGNSMNPMILENDILVVDCSKELLSNQIIVATLDGERICKRFTKKGGEVYLLSDNKAYPPLIIDKERDFIIFGPVIGLVRQFE